MWRVDPDGRDGDFHAVFRPTQTPLPSIISRCHSPILVWPSNPVGRLFKAIIKMVYLAIHHLSQVFSCPEYNVFSPLKSW